MNKLDIEKIKVDAFVSSVMVGNCPKCGSDNTHDCTALEEVPAREVGGFKFPKMTEGHDCPVALRIDDPCVGHCDSCGYIWCLECENELSEDNPICGHWNVCDKCGRTEEFPSTCQFKEEAESGELLVNPCLLDCPFIDKCSRCPYTSQIQDCSTIIKWKRDTKEN